VTGWPTPKQSWEPHIPPWLSAPPTTECSTRPGQPYLSVFVAPGEFDQRLSALARRAKGAREEGDYEAAPASPEEAAEFVKGTAEFLAAIERLLLPPPKS
jgi:hypothetical protein